jgi:RNA polymerase sigma-70 factor, ECF subfamily
LGTAGKGEALSEQWPTEMPFASVVERARTLDHTALSLLYRRYLPVVYRYVLGRIGDVHLAEDVTSETFIGMVDTIERVRAGDELGFAAWLLGIARHKVAEHYRRQAARPLMQPPGEPWDEPLAQAEAGDPLGVVTARESWAEVVAALQRLTEEQRTVVLYRCVLGYGTEEVARLLDRQPGAIRALQFRALTALARFLAVGGTNPAVAALRAELGGPARAARAQRNDDAPRR